MRIKFSMRSTLFMMFWASVVLGGGIRIKDFSFHQRWPWNGLVDIRYTVESDIRNLDGSPILVRLRFLGYDRDQNQTVELKSLKGDGAKDAVPAGGTYSLVWDARKDYPTFNSSAFQIKVEASTVSNESSAPFPGALFHKGRYLVIDLSGGPRASRYPYRYSEAGPDLRYDLCRTQELWLREIPAGTYMKTTGTNGGSRVSLSHDFYLGVFELTQRQWDLVMGERTLEHRYPGACRPVDRVPLDVIRGPDNGSTSWPRSGHAVTGDSFMGRLRERTGLTFDLPTEAQWEYASRAGTITSLNDGHDLAGGDGDVHLDALGRYSFNRKDGRGGYQEHTRVGSYQPNAWGLYDMHGNVAERCLDWYDNSPGESGYDPMGPQSGEYRVWRGGHWGDDARACSNDCRDGGQQNEAGWGLRVAVVQDDLSRNHITSGRYVVIDLSGGPSAESYPHRLSHVGPDVTDDRCRTTELWLREIPAGTFMMGSNYPNGGEQHRVTLETPYYLSVFEVTQKQWSLVMGAVRDPFPGECRPVISASYDMVRGASPSAGAGWPASGHRVDRDSFLGRLQTKTGLTLDLPTEAQWEHGCRAGSLTSLYSGQELTGHDTCGNLALLGRYNGNQQDGRGGYDKTTKVGSYQPNAYGLYDMLGNASEWCLDFYEDRIAQERVVEPHGPWSGEFRVLRGGNFASSAGGCSTMARGRTKASEPYHGIRLAYLPKSKIAGVEPGRYVVIDLSSGAESTSYSYRFSTTGPDLSSQACRTTELWLREIPAGSYMMGRRPTDYGWNAVTSQREVTLTKVFYLGVFEVTQGQWRLVMGNNPAQYRGDGRPVEMVSYDMLRGQASETLGWPQHGHAVATDSFFGRLQQRTGLTLDLPTEAEWEYGCRAGTVSTLNSGHDLSTFNPDEPCSYANELGRYKANQRDGRKGRIYLEHTVVGSYAPNRWGLYDMHGNVLEWCVDWGGQETLTSSSVTDPVGAETGTTRCVRGGAWTGPAAVSYWRAGSTPDTRYYANGFRVAAFEVPAPKP